LNTFMFCFWSQGLRIGDCLRLKWGNIEDGIIVLRMEKTDRELIIQLNSSNIHRIKWYMSSYYPIWDWTNKKWNNYYQCDDFDPNKYNEWLFSHETDCQEFVNMIEEEKDENYQMMSLFTGPNFERIELDRYGSRYNKIIKDKVPTLFESRDERLDMVNRELIKSISDYANKEENKNKFIFPFLRGFEDEKDSKKNGQPAPVVTPMSDKETPQPFKLGEIPKQIKEGPHIDASATLMSAIKSLDPNQINAMTKDTKQLIETQKSLMNMLGTMKPMMNDGKELMETFNQMFGK